MPVTDEQFRELCQRLDTIQEDIEHIAHGNGRAGLHNVLDDVYGPRNRERPGLINRVTALEVEVRAIKARASENAWMQRGIAIGVALVAAEHVFGLDLAGILRAWFGGGA